MSSPKYKITYSEHAQNILECAMSLAKNRQRFALVMSVDIEGGAARSIGSMAVVSDGGDMTGYLSNGCIDRDIILQSLSTLETKKVKSVRYGAGSPYLDMRLPCGGALELVIDPDPNIDVLKVAYEDLLARRSTRIKMCPSNGVLPPNTTISTSENATEIEYSPKPRLILAGRGAIMLKTAKLAAEMEFDLCFVSPDELELSELSDLQPSNIIRLRSPSDQHKLPIDRHTAVMLLFHDHEWEQSILMSSALQEPFFIGAMGSVVAHSLRLNELMANGLLQKDCDKIRGPIGLVPSLRNASLIAASALAEVISVLPVGQQRVG